MINYTISAYKHNATLIKNIQGYSLSAGLAKILSGGSGAVDPAFVSVGEIRPEFTFDTTAIKSALAGIGGISGDVLTNDTFYFQKMLAGGLRGGASLHHKGVMATGLIIPVRIRAVQGQQAVISYRVIPTSADGSATPIAFTALQSLEAAQDIITEIYTMGPVTLNGVALEGVSEWTIDLGITIWDNIVDGKVYRKECGILTRNPVITITSFDVGTMAGWDLDGIAQGATDSTLQLLDQVDAGVRGVAPITFSLDAGIAHYEAINGSQGQQLGGSVIFQPVYDGTNAIIAIAGIT